MECSSFFKYRKQERRRLIENMTKELLINACLGYKSGLYSLEELLTTIEHFSSASNSGKPQCSKLLPSVQEMIDVIEAEKVKYPRMWTADVLRLLNRVKELAAIA